MTDQLEKSPIPLDIIPSNQLPGFREDLATMDKLHRDLAPILAEARKLKDLGWKKWDAERRTRAGELVKEYKRIITDAEETIEKYKKIVNRFKEEYILTPERKVNNAAEEIKAVITPEMASWDREDARIAAEEKARKQRELQAELDRQAELKRQADEAQAKQLREQRVAEIRTDLAAGKFGNPKTATAKRKAQKLLEEAGASEEAMKTKAAADEQEAKENAKKTVETVRVAPLSPSVPGNVKRVTYSAECTDQRQFIRSLLAQKDVHSFERLLAVVEVSNQKLSAEARERIKTSPDDTAHDLTVAEFEKLYPFVKVEEKRSY